MEASDSQAKVTVALEGFRQRFAGGTIRPVNRKTLTIPLVPEAYGKLAPEFGDLQFRPVYGAAKLVGVLEGKAGSAFEGQSVYALVRFVVQGPDPSVLPPEKAMAEEAVSALRKAVERMERKT